MASPNIFFVCFVHPCAGLRERSAGFILRGCGASSPKPPLPPPSWLFVVGFSRQRDTRTSEQSDLGQKGEARLELAHLPSCPGGGKWGCKLSRSSWNSRVQDCSEPRLQVGAQSGALPRSLPIPERWPKIGSQRTSDSDNLLARDLKRRGRWEELLTIYIP